MAAELTPKQIEARERFVIGLEAKTKNFLVSQGACAGKYSEQDPSNGIHYCSNDRASYCPNRDRTLGPSGSSERVPYCKLNGSLKNWLLIL